MPHYDSRIYDFVKKGITRAFNLFNKLNLDDGSYPYYAILEAKISADKPLRAVFTYLIKRNIDILGGQFSDLYKKQFWQGQLPFIVEVLMTILYYDNQILDRKAGVISHEAIANNLMIGRQLQAQLTLYIQKYVPAKFRGKVQRMVQDIIQVVCAGQQMERACNFYRHWKSEQFDPFPFANLLQSHVPNALIEEIKGIIYRVCPEIQGKNELFLTKYLERVYLVNAYLFERVTRFILDALETPIEEEGELIRFAGMFGMMHQLVNDNADYLPSHFGEKTVAKKASDGMKDISNGLITLPTIIYLLRNNHTKAIKGYLDKLEVQEIGRGLNERVFFSEICKSHAIYFAIDVTYKLEELTLNGLKIEDENSYWLEHTKIAKNNRYYRYFYLKKPK